MTGAETKERPAEVESSALVEAIAVIDKALAETLRRELISSGEVSDLLLDVRTLLASALAAASPS